MSLLRKLWKVVSRKVAQRIINTTPLNLKNPDLWKKFLDNNTGTPSGDYMIPVAQRWAKLMQHEIESNGKKLPEVAKRTYALADDRGVSGHLYAHIVLVLSQTWQYGEDLRRWHNAEHGATEESANGRVVNPAMHVLETPTRSVNMQKTGANRTLRPA